MTLGSGTTLITGGAGFIGTNIAHRALNEGGRVVILDNLSRPGVDENVNRLLSMHSAGRVRVHVGDVRDAGAVRRALAGVDRVFHLAAQVAVTTSLVRPIEDFEVNLLGTLTVLEELRRLEKPPPLLFTSTNKVYGDLPDIDIRLRNGRWEPADHHIRQFGISEVRPLAFCSPYGCSKGGADQYVIDYAKSFNVRAIVFRMSCIYGPHQCGNEDQGWLAHFILRAMSGHRITLFGDGKQVRDVLHVDDLVRAMELAMAKSSTLSGRAFNIGGGPAHTTSLLELLDLIGSCHGRPPSVAHGSWRVGDQRWYVSDTRAFGAATGWRPRIDVRAGVHDLHRWFQRRDLVPTVAEAI